MCCRTQHCFLVESHKKMWNVAPFCTQKIISKSTFWIEWIRKSLPVINAPNTWQCPRHDLYGVFLSQIYDPFGGDFEKRRWTRHGHVMFCAVIVLFHMQGNVVQLNDPGRRSCAFDKNLGTALSCMWYLAKKIVCVIQNIICKQMLLDLDIPT